VKSRVSIRRLRFAAAALVLWPAVLFASQTDTSTSIFSTLSTPAAEENRIAFFVLGITAAIFLGVASLLTYALIRYRARKTDTEEPPQVFGSTQIELSWTIIPILIVTVLFLGTARVLFSVQDAPKPANALDVTAVGHQFWWEYRYPQYNVTAANELHIPVGQGAGSRVTYLKLTSADVMHSFWIPQLGGKTDMLPNRVNQMWIDPQKPGVYLGQCGQFCGTQHAKMLLRVSVDTPEEFSSWIANQQKAQSELPHETVNVNAGSDVATGQRVFEQQACINCHTISGTVANGRFGPDLTHLMSRTTLAAGAMENTPENLKAWITDPNPFKPGCLMPAMHLTDQQYAQITTYLLTLK
jgi:cytochrome c oxidase subunit II